jgi:hypothetical protein
VRWGLMELKGREGELLWRMLRNGQAPRDA